MVKVASCFAQVLELVDRNDFARAVKELDAERGAKGFRCWDQLVAMLFCQVGSVHSLRWSRRCHRRLSCSARNGSG